MLLTRQEHLEEAERWLRKAQESNEDHNVPFQKMQVMLKFAEVHTLIATVTEYVGELIALPS